jgi:hypothetical protein
MHGGYAWIAFGKLQTWGFGPDDSDIDRVEIAATDANEFSAAYYAGEKRKFFLAAIWDNRDFTERRRKACDGDLDATLCAGWSFHS